MICFSCGHCSQHVVCPFCRGARTIPGGQIHVAGFSVTELLNPIKLAADTWGSRDTNQTPYPPSTTTEGPSMLDRLKSYNPFATAYDLGYKGGDVAKETVTNLGGDLRAPFDAMASFFSILKWVVIGGAVVGAVVLVYGVLKFVPVALGAAAGNLAQVNKMVPDIAAKALRV